MSGRLTAESILERFVAEGATPIAPDLLQPAETLLDLYGEDIRARAFVTQDPIAGEMMLRPDFTVPVVLAHMQCGASPARYAYSGRVFRCQEQSGRPREYEQVGFELFAQDDPHVADAEVFALFSDILAGVDVARIIGDMGLLLAAIEGLSTSDARKAALRRHLWRPQRFKALLARFAGVTPQSDARRDLLAQTQDLEALLAQNPEIGKRSVQDVKARIEALRADAELPALSQSELDMFTAISEIHDTAPKACARLQELQRDVPALQDRVMLFEKRLDALAHRGIDLDGLTFEGTYGRTSMEYYDGFVFGFTSADDPDQPTLASGGRYDALTRVLGAGATLPAVGGVIRPGLLETLS